MSRIEIRDEFKRLVEERPRFADRTKIYRFDRMEVDAASVYLGRLESSTETMGRTVTCAERTLSVLVDMFIIAPSGDADALLDAELIALEAAVTAAARANTLPRVTSLVRADFTASETARERAGILTTSWECVYDETI